MFTNDGTEASQPTEQTRAEKRYILWTSGLGALLKLATGVALLVAERRRFLAGIAVLTGRWRLRREFTLDGSLGHDAVPCLLGPLVGPLGPCDSPGGIPRERGKDHAQFASHFQHIADRDAA